MDAPPELALRHGFEAQEFPEDSGGLFEGSNALETGIVRYTHGYVDPWQSAREPGDTDEFDSVVPATDRIYAWDPLAPEQVLEDVDQDVAHGDEAAAWAAVGRRALLKRMSED